MRLGNLGEKMKILQFCFLFVLCFGRVFATPEEEAVLKFNVVSHIHTLEGWCSKEKAVEFIDLILQEKPKTWVEIGVFGGSSLFPVLSAFQYLGEGKAYAIDPWDKIECIKHFDPVLESTDLRWWGNLNLNQIYQSFTNMLQKFKLGKFCTIIRKTSELAVTDVPEIDVLYIDGNHAELPSLLDAEMYLPKVKSGGYVWFNDALWEQRQKAVEYLLLSCDVVKVIENGNCLLLKKR